MSKSILSTLFVICFFCLSVSAYALAQEVPSSIKPVFEKKYEGAKVISHHEINGEHRIIFQQGSEVKSARFDGSGNWIDTIISLNPGTAPSSVTEYISSKYPTHNGHTRRIESADGVSYMVFVSETKAVRFDKDGNFVKEETIDAIEEEALADIK